MIVRYRFRDSANYFALFSDVDSRIARYRRFEIKHAFDIEDIADIECANSSESAGHRSKHEGINSWPIRGHRSPSTNAIKFNSFHHFKAISALNTNWRPDSELFRFIKSSPTERSTLQFELGTQLHIFDLISTNLRLPLNLLTFTIIFIN